MKSLDCSLRSRSLKELLLNNFQSLSGFVLFFLLRLLKEEKSFNASVGKIKTPAEEAGVKIVRVNDGIRTHDPRYHKPML